MHQVIAGTLTNSRTTVATDYNKNITKTTTYLTMTQHRTT